MADAGASAVIPIRAGEVKKGGHVMIKEHPCKVIEVTTSKTGKHGHAKANITGIDIFEGSKHMDISPTSHNMEAPVVTTTNYTIIDVGPEMFATLMDAEGETREDLNLDIEKYEHQKKVHEEFLEKGECEVRVIKACGREMIFPLAG
ncbi:hypothetical protein FNF27_01260 [Cafeteria roenbergensis]|uniref:Eukaryotic translation initiation factor 5A n=1 Tax=Cafeteria roenbergensis TaxID=33653 RepID=A0A5A8CXF9_CAFRO|nr:hypothetical protein FNF29_00710 [Cafeteria roenbergensis]KAA0157369.1 hypothetical protein FNF28_06523 [Cafeteria roenbergensis]KAA0159634.1 hypothetical protein FNF31_04710 [Cafeteria roenbergensis]KAA0177483.1 hypothetical protein FNF27_01260 [Cafeteria roenbergensis]|eukprot:KAA0156599.1 hypothetical protein FNF29_00710 [Cafeteria roenbergensis]